jgi:hypothetical protein
MNKDQLKKDQVAAPPRSEAKPTYPVPVHPVIQEAAQVNAHAAVEFLRGELARTGKTLRCTIGMAGLIILVLLLIIHHLLTK